MCAPTFVGAVLFLSTVTFEISGRAHHTQNTVLRMKMEEFLSQGNFTFISRYTIFSWLSLSSATLKKKNDRSSCFKERRKTTTLWLLFSFARLFISPSCQHLMIADYSRKIGGSKNTYVCVCERLPSENILMELSESCLSCLHYHYTEESDYIYEAWCATSMWLMFFSPFFSFLFCFLVTSACGANFSLRTSNA